jgi:hypothetical protein
MKLSPARRRAFALAAASLSSAGLYVAANLGTIAVVPLLHRVTVTVDVVDDAAKPVAGANVRIEPWSWQLASAARVGSYRGEQLCQQQPVWVWPTLGTFDWRDAALVVEARGFAPCRVPLARQLPALPLAEANGRLRVGLRRE